MRTDSEVLRQGGAGAASTQDAAFSPVAGVGETATYDANAFEAFEVASYPTRR